MLYRFQYYLVHVFFLGYLKHVCATYVSRNQMQHTIHVFPTKDTMGPPASNCKTEELPQPW